MPFDAKGPFPLSFKGKGDLVDWRHRSLQRRLEQTRVARDETEQSMRALIDDFKQTFRPPWPAHLTLHNTGNGQYIRWRLRGSRLVKQQYFELSGNGIGLNFLNSLSSSAREVYLEFEQERLKLNLLYGLHHYEAKRLQHYLDATHHLDVLRRGI